MDVENTRNRQRDRTHSFLTLSGTKFIFSYIQFSLLNKVGLMFARSLMLYGGSKLLAAKMFCLRGLLFGG